MASDRTSLRVGVAYATLCVVWGSTFLAIAIALRHLPPMALAALRFVIAGVVLVLLAWRAGHRLPSGVAEWRTTILVGVLLLGVGNGLVVWAQQYVGSGTASIFVVTVSLWMAFFDAVIPGSPARVTTRQALGLLAGFGGTLLLVGNDLESLRQADWRGPVGLTVSAAAWAFGSVYSQRRRVSSGPYMNAGLQTLAGGLGLTLVASFRGEWTAVTLTTPGVLAVLYLVVFGSVIGFTAYMFVLRSLPATIAGTYVYANTVFAVLLGWLVLNEPFTARTLLAMSIVIGAVVWVKYGGRRTTLPGTLSTSRA